MFYLNVLVICAVALYLYKRRKLAENHTSNEIENGIIHQRPENTENEDNRKMTD